MIETWGLLSPLDAMPEEILLDLGPIIQRHPWWQARARLVEALLRREGFRASARVLDAGCGWGVTLQHLERRGFEVVGLDLSIASLRCLDNASRHLVAADLRLPPPADVAPFDAVLALDVLEHLVEDRQAAEHLSRLVRPGGLLIASVPALPELYSEFDAVQGHKRRYVPDTLRSVLDLPSLHLERILWWGSLMVPVLRRQRRRAGAPSPLAPSEVYRSYLGVPAPLRPILRLMLAVEERLTLSGASRTGTSLFALARRRIA